MSKSRQAVPCWIAERDLAGPAPIDDMDGAVDGAAAMEAAGLRVLAERVRELEQQLGEAQRDAAESRGFLDQVNAAAEAERAAAQSKIVDLNAQIKAANRREAWGALPYYVAIAAAATLGSIFGIVGTLYQMPA